MESTVTGEILHTVSCQPEISVYYFGSQADGTTTTGMKSDLDVVNILNNLPVVTDPQDHPAGTSLLFIQDATTPAGYCKLQLVQDGVPQHGEIPKSNPYPDIYCRNRLQFTRDTDSRWVCCFKPNKNATRGIDQRHGPALTRNATKKRLSVDFVHAVECQRISRFINTWLNRKRKFNWPADYILQTCVDLGCLFVPVGHPKCVDTEQEKQWRISFSHQEKLLVSQFSPVQYKCFIVLKIIKKELISESVPDSLSSYHVKTCMFHAIENTPCTLWKPENLLSCISLCLRKLLEWIQAGYCPNYFIPEENMFDRPVHNIVRKRLRQVLQRLVSADCKFLYSIQCDGLGKKFKYNTLIQCVTTGDVDDSNYISIVAKLRKLRDVCFKTFRYGIRKLTKISNNNIESNLKKTLQSISALLNTLIITRHTLEETQQAKSLILPYLELTLMSNIVAYAVDQNEQNRDIRRLLTSIRWKEIGLSSDSFSSRLKQASMLYMLGDYQTSLNVLSSLTGLVRYSDCKCYLDEDIYVSPDDATLLETTRGIPDVTAQYLLRNVIIPCVYFLPTERSVTPAALCYEMERMRGPRPDSDDDLCDHDEKRGDWAFVDGNFLLHFLLYLNHTKLNREHQVNVDINTMRRLLARNNAKRLSHRETCFNLLGWVYREEGNNDTANSCFRESLRIKPHCNAAFQFTNDLEITVSSGVSNKQDITVSSGVSEISPFIVVDEENQQIFRSRRPLISKRRFISVMVLVALTTTAVILIILLRLDLE